jgi:hypothetical protein
MSDITRLLRGKTFAAAMTNGHVLRLQCSDGAEIDICWVDDNGHPIKGKPVMTHVGVRLDCRGIHDLIPGPGAWPGH